MTLFNFTKEDEELKNKRKILLVDDEPYNLMGMSIILEHLAG